LAIQPGHIHSFVHVLPSDSAADGVKECKGFTASELRKKYSAILKNTPIPVDSLLFCQHGGQPIGGQH
jgi:REP element-mobilizing transposase RayT